MYIYYPSCNFKKHFPETAGHILAYLNSQADVTVTGCCSVCHTVPEKGDIIVTICTSCMRQLEEVCPDNRIISFYEFMLTRNDFIWPDYDNKTIVLQDCFRAIGKHDMQDAVRTCLVRMNFRTEELPHNRDTADFDGSFLLHDPYPQNMQRAPKYFRDYLPAHITPVPEEQRKDYYMDYVKRYSGRSAVCYCNTCLLGAKAGGADARHLASLMFDSRP